MPFVDHISTKLGKQGFAVCKKTSSPEGYLTMQWAVMPFSAKNYSLTQSVNKSVTLSIFVLKSRAALRRFFDAVHFLCHHAFVCHHQTA